MSDRGEPAVQPELRRRARVAAPRRLPRTDGPRRTRAGTRRCAAQQAGRHAEVGSARRARAHMGIPGMPGIPATVRGPIIAPTTVRASCTAKPRRRPVTLAACDSRVLAGPRTAFPTRLGDDQRAPPTGRPRCQQPEPLPSKCSRRRSGPKPSASIGQWPDTSPQAPGGSLTDASDDSDHQSVAPNRKPAAGR